MHLCRPGAYFHPGQTPPYLTARAVRQLRSGRSGENAKGGTRTPTPQRNWILSPVRLPIPPLSRTCPATSYSPKPASAIIIFPRAEPAPDRREPCGSGFLGFLTPGTLNDQMLSEMSGEDSKTQLGRFDRFRTSDRPNSTNPASIIDPMPTSSPMWRRSSATVRNPTVAIPTSTTPAILSLDFIQWLQTGYGEPPRVFLVVGIG